MKITVKLDTKITQLMKNIERHTGEVVAGIIEEEFINMLYDAPQKTGNFVANMQARPGSRQTSSGPGLVFPITSDPSLWFARGQMPAIQYAMRSNAGLKERMTRHLGKGGGWLDSVTFYNNLKYAEKVEGYDDSQLRSVNKGGAHPLAKLEARLEARARGKIVYGSPEWHRLRRLKKL